MIRSLKLFATSLFLAVSATLPAFAQDQEVRATHGSWEVICLKGSDNCTMQQIGKSAQGEDALLVRISKVNATAQDGTQIPASAEIVAPLGVVLPAGVRVQVDNGQVRGTNYRVCIQVGCLAQDVISEAFLADMKKGSTAKMTVILPPNREVAVNISLTGFTKAFNELQPLRRSQ
ncbi:MAG: invasion associated locus B family protein [Pseudomonadota bacterium]